MLFETLGNLGDFIGGIAVVITLIYLSYQIRQNTKEVRNNAIQALLDRSTTLFNENIHSPMADIFAKLTDDEQLTHSEKWRLHMFVRRNFQLYELVYLQFREGRISQPVMDAYRRRIESTMLRSFWADIWPEIRTFYTDDFVKYVDGCTLGGKC